MTEATLACTHVALISVAVLSPGAGIQSLGWEDTLEKELVIHSSILAWRIPWTEEPGRLEALGSEKVGSDLIGTHAQERLRAGNSYLECILS